MKRGFTPLETTKACFARLIRIGKNGSYHPSQTDNLRKRFNGRDGKRFLSLTGFTLLEITISIFVLTVGILGAYGLLNFNLTAVSGIRDRLIAANLAQEQIEVVRNIRDANWLNDRTWDTGIPASSDLNVNYNSVSLSNLPDGLNFNGTYYTHSAPPNDTPFSRHIEISKLTDSDGYQYMQIKSIVSWADRGRPYQLIVENNLYDWR